MNRTQDSSRSCAVDKEFIGREEKTHRMLGQVKPEPGALCLAHFFHSCSALTHGTARETRSSRCRSV